MDVAIAAVIPLYIGAKLSRERSGASLRSEVISIHLPPPVMIESAADRALVIHMLCWS